MAVQKIDWLLQMNKKWSWTWEHDNRGIKQVDNRLIPARSVGVQVAFPCSRCMSLTLQEADQKVRYIFWNITKLNPSKFLNDVRSVCDAFTAKWHTSEHLRVNLLVWVPVMSLGILHC